MAKLKKPEVLSFDQAIAKASRLGKVKLLTGNGFSRACMEDVFNYSALFEQAKAEGLSETAQEAFKALQTNDFEVVIEALRMAASLLKLYGPKEPKLAAVMMRDAKSIKEVLVKAIARSHPDMPSKIRDSRYVACRKFLAHFETIYTLNYDLLLYWALMKDELQPEIPHDDGFRTSEDEPDAEYVTWEADRYKQNVWYLHGGLQIFDGGYEIQKYTWVRTGIRLMDQIREALDADLFPVFVSEGSSRDKKRRILHNAYLAKAYRSFQAVSGVLVIHGHSLAESDEHILKLIERSKVSELFIGLHGDAESPANQHILARAAKMVLARDKGRSLNVSFYNSDTAKVWG